MAMSRAGREVVQSILNEQRTVEDLKNLLDPEPKSQLREELNAHVHAAIERRVGGSVAGV